MLRDLSQATGRAGRALRQMKAKVRKVDSRRVGVRRVKDEEQERDEEKSVHAFRVVTTIQTSSPRADMPLQAVPCRLIRRVTEALFALGLLPTLPVQWRWSPQLA
jgi:hypothetical protein